MMEIQHWRLRDRYYRLLGNKCKDCGSEFFPPVYRCKDCKSENLVDKEMPRRGKIITYTHLYEPLPGFEAQLPVTLAMIELENGVKVIGQIVDSPTDKISTGQAVRAVVRRMRVDGESGQILYGYKFVIDER